MALDSKEKRANVIGVGRPWMRGSFPVAIPDVQWRASSGNSYGGNAGITTPLVRGVARPQVEGCAQSAFGPTES